MSEKSESVVIQQLINRLTNIDNALKKETNPYNPLRALETLMKEISSPNDERFETFIGKLNKIVQRLLLRGDYEEIAVPRISAFLKTVTQYAVDSIPYHLEATPEIFCVLFSWEKKYTFYKQYGRNQIQHDDQEIFTNEEWDVSKIMLANINVFIRASGYKHICDLIESRRCTLVHVHQELKVIDKMHDMLRPAITKTVLDMVVTTTFKYLLEMPEDEVKNADKKLVIEIVDLCKKFLDRMYLRSETPSSSQEQIDKFRLSLALRWLQLPFLNKRIEGLADLSLFCKFFTHTQSHPQKKEQEMWINAKYLTEWLYQNKVVEYLFGKASHPEIIRRSGDILQFLASEGQINTRDLDIIWEASLNQHESITHQVWNIIGHLTHFIGTSLIDYLYEKIKKLPLTSYDTQFVNFLRQVTENGINNITHGMDKRWYGIEQFWNGMKDNSGLSLEVALQCLHSLTYFILSNNYDRDDIIIKCIENMKNNVSIPQSTNILSKIIATFKTNSENDKIIAWLEDNHHLTDLIFQNVVSYSQYVLKSVSEVPPGTNIDAHTFCGYYCHSLYIKQLLDFLEFIYRHSALVFTEQQVDILWSAMVTSAVTEGTRDMALGWFQTAAEASYFNQLTQYVFNEKLPSLDFRTLSSAGFAFIQNYFMRINFLNGKLHRVQDEIIVHNSDLLGIDHLWRVALETENQEVGIVSINLLNRLQKNISSNIRAGLVEYRESHLTRAMTSLCKVAETYIAAKDDWKTKSILELSISRMLKLMQNFIESFEVGLVQEKHGAGGRGVDMQLKVKGISSPIIVVDTHGNETLGEFRAKIAEVFENGKYTPDQLRLIVAGKELKDDTVLMKDTGLQSGHTVYIMPLRKSISPPVVGPMAVATVQQNIPSAPTTRPPLTEEEKKALPSTILAQDKFFEQFFQLLNFLPENMCSQIWVILEKLPTNTKMKAAIQNLPSNPDWNILLYPQSIFKLYYSLQIVESLTHTTKEDQEEQKQAWSLLFVQTRGIHHLFKIFLNTDFFLPLHGNKRIYCLALLLKIINFFLINMENNIPTIRSDIFHTLGCQEIELLQKLFNIIRNASLPTNQLLPPKQYSLIPIKTESDDVVIAAMALLVATIFRKPVIISDFYSIAFSDWLEAVLFSNPLQPSREAIANGIYHICAHFGLKSSLIPENLNPMHRFLQKLLEYLPSLNVDEKNVNENPYVYKCAEYFRLLNNLVRDYCRETNDTLTPEFKQLLNKVVEMIKSHPIIETNTQSQEDKILMGLLDLTRTLLGVDISTKTELGEILIPEIFHSCLFDIPTLEKKGNPPKCKTSAARKSAFNLLMELIRGSESNMIMLCSSLIQYHGKQSYKKQWQYYPQAYEKAPCGYVGLKNLGATCYMNSLVQQFFMVSQFRYNILSIEDKSEPKAESVLSQLQAIFANLQESEKKYFDTKDFTKSYKIDGEPMKTSEQMDVDEFFAQLFDKLDSKLKGTGQEKLLQSFFGGTLVNQIISKECEHRSERSEISFNIQLEVKNKLKLQDSLDLFVQGDMLDGDNKYFCDSCNTKVAALKRCCIGKLPNHLIIHLKRFEFDLESMRRNKVNQYCEFSHKLNLEPYTAEGLLRRERMEKNGGTLEPPVHPLSYYDYELTGILVHSGTTESGHYYSFVRDSITKNWFRFNDIHVTPFESLNIPDQCYGGYDIQEVWDSVRQRNIPKNIPRSYNAYLLFYERCHPETPSVEKPIPVSRQSEVVPRELYNQVWEKNMKFLMDKHLFDKDYINFVYELILLYDPKKLQIVPHVTNMEVILDPNYPDPLMKVIQLGTKFFVQTFSHAFEKKNIQEFVEHLKALYSKHIPSCQWFIYMLTNKTTWVMELLFLCTLPDTRELFAKLVSHVVNILDSCEWMIYQENDIEEIPAEPTKQMSQELTEREEELANAQKLLKITGTPKSQIVRFLDSLLKMCIDAKGYWRNYNQFWLLFQDIALVSTPMRILMLSRGYLRYFCHIYLGEDSPFFIGKKIKDKTKEKIQQELQAVQNMRYLLGAICVLVNACKIPRDIQGAKSPTEIYEELLDLPREETDLVLGTQFLFKATGDNSNCEAMADLARHISWENRVYSYKIIDITCDGINKYEGERFPPFLFVLKAVLSIEDSLQQIRVQYAMAKYLRVIENNLKYKNATRSAISFFIEYVSQNKLVEEYLLNHLDSWIKQWLFYSTGEKTDGDELVRFTTETLIMELVPEFKGYQVSVKPELIPSSAKPNVKEYEVTIEAKSRLHMIYCCLLSTFDTLSKIPYDVMSVETPITSDERYSFPFRYISLFRLLQWCLVSQVEQQLFIDKDYKNSFINFYQIIDAKHIDCDLNKTELYKFWDKLTCDNIKLIKYFTDDQNVRNRMLDTYIKLSPQRQIIYYNNETLPFYYQLFYRFAVSSENFKSEMIKNQNYYWAIKHLYIESREYPKPAVVLRNLLEVGLENPDFRKFMVQQMLQTGIPARHNNWPHIFDVLSRILRDEPEQCYFCSVNGLQVLLDVYIKRQKDWTIEDLQTLVVASSTAISWLKKSPNPDLLNLRESLITGTLDQLVSKVYVFIPNLKVEHIQAGNAILEFLSNAISCDPRILKRVLCYFSNYKDRPTPFDIRHHGFVDEWKEKLVLFTNQLCDQTIIHFGNDKDITSQTLKIAFVNSIDSLMLSSELSTVNCVKLLDKIWTSAQNPSDLLKEYGEFITDFVAKLIIKRFDKLFVEDKILINFVSKVFPTIQVFISHDIKSSISSVLEDKILFMANFIKNYSQDPLKAPIIVNELIMLYSIMKLLFIDPQIKESLFRFNKNQLLYFKQLVDERSKNFMANIQNIDVLVSLVQHIE